MKPVPKTTKARTAFAVLTKTLWALVYALPAILFFSYYPIISLGANNSMNFELSLPLIWLVAFDFLSFIFILFLGWRGALASTQKGLPETKRASTRTAKNNGPVRTGARVGLWKNLLCGQHQGLSDRRFFLLALFPLYLTLSVLWSANPLRGLLTAGVAWLIFCAVFAILYILPLASPPSHLRRNVLRSLLISGVLVSIFCFIQSILDTAGLSRDTTLMCAGCTYRSFGFPHPSGFAIEPQFMGNLLLAPTLTALYLIVFHDSKTPKSSAHNASSSSSPSARFNAPRPRPNLTSILLTLTATFLSTTLFFTFSRGAIYAYAVALLVLLIFALRRHRQNRQNPHSHHRFRWSLITIPVASFLLALILQGTFAAVGPTSETFTSGITKSIHQLSLGLIDLRPTASSGLASQNTTSDSSNTNPNNPLVNPSPNPVENSSQDCGKPVDKIAENVDNSTKTVENNSTNVENNAKNCANPVQNPVDNPVENPANQPQTPTQPSTVAEDQSLAANQPHFDGYVAESTNIRLQLNQVALWTWLAAPNREGLFPIGLDCHYVVCNISTHLTPTSILFGVGLGGAGTAMHAAHPNLVTSPKEIVQHQGFSLLLETGLVGILLLIFDLLICFFPNLFPRKFLDGRATQEKATTKSLQNRESTHSAQLATPHSASAKTQLAPSSSHTSELPTFWHHPALPLLLSLIISYLVTLNFFSGLPNALQIYLMPPLLYLIFANLPVAKTPPRSAKTSKTA